MRITIAAAVLFSAAMLLADDPKCPPNYGYCGYAPPEQWGAVSETCATGRSQSPITLDHAREREGKAVHFDYHQTKVTVMNSGHDFRALLPAPTNNTAVFPHASGTYVLQNFHFHTPSEHEKKPGQKYRGEIHLVHANGKAVAVVAFFLEVGTTDNRALVPFFKALPLDLCDTGEADFDLTAFSALAKGPYYTYSGSLTTPPCDEGVQFYIYPEPIKIGRNQLEKLHQFGDNARPVKSTTRQVELVKAP